MRAVALSATMVAFLATGCALIPDTIHVATSHMSQPMRGVGPVPLGGDDMPETTLDAIELGGRWQDGNWFAESSFAYVVHSTYFVGGDVLFTAKVGIQWSIK